jgi:cytoskeletal protein RodZ
MEETETQKEEEDIMEEQQESTPMPELKKRRLNMWTKTLVVVAIITVLALVAYFFYPF